MVDPDSEHRAPTLIGLREHLVQEFGYLSRLLLNDSNSRRVQLESPRCDFLLFWGRNGR